MFPPPTVAPNDVPLTTTEGHEDMEATTRPGWTKAMPYNYEAKPKVKVTDLVDGSPAVVTYPEEVFNYNRDRVVGWGGEVVREIIASAENGFDTPETIRIGSIDLPFQKNNDGYVLTTDVLLEQLAELVNKEIDDKVRAAFEEGFAAASVPVLAEGQL